MKTTRRNFLKYLGGLAVSVVAIPSFLKPKRVEAFPFLIYPYLTDNEAWYLTEQDAREDIASQSVFKGDPLYIDVDGRVFAKGRGIYGSINN